MSQYSSPSSPAVVDAVQPYIDRGAVAGAVALVANADRILSSDVFGWADIEAKKPMRPDSTFWIASMTKPITATALMILVDEGKVRIEEPVETYLPEMKDLWLAAEKADDHITLKRPARPITVRDILCHTSGMGFCSKVEQPTLDGLPLRSAVLSYAMTPLDFEPGTNLAYSNCALNTAGRIIEVMSGQSYESFLDERLLGPLGMVDTTFWPNSEQVSRLATAYKPNESQDRLTRTTIEQLTYPLDGPGRYPMPAGGLFSTASDVLRIMQMVMNKGELDGRRYLSPEAVKTMTTVQTKEGLDKFGLGWWSGDGRFEHGGALATNMRGEWATGLIRIWLVQHAGFPLDGAEAHAAFLNASERPAS